MQSPKLRWLDVSLIYFAATHDLNLSPVVCQHCFKKVPYSRCFFLGKFAGVSVADHGCPSEANAILMVPIDAVERRQLAMYAELIKGPISEVDNSEKSD